jgi:hypothetical protein
MKNTMDLQRQLVNALNLPERTTKLELVFESGKMPVIKCEYLVHGASGEGLLATFRGFELIPRHDARRIGGGDDPSQRWRRVRGPEGLPRPCHCDQQGLTA